ncbi:DUF4393 domain-containing protein [Salinicoccus sp. CNSTN-B1]
MDSNTVMAIGTAFATSIVTKGAESPGQTLNLAWRFAFYRVDELFRAGIIKQENAQKFKEEIIEQANKIPESDRIDPKTNIITNAMSSAATNLDEDEIRNMFAKLIASSMDGRKASYLHPSFTEIIKQLSPNDAQFLKRFEITSDLPMVRYTEDFNENGGHVYRSDFFCLPFQGDYTQTVNSIDNLVRLNLVTYPSHGISLSDKNSYRDFHTEEIKRKILDYDDQFQISLIQLASTEMSEDEFQISKDELISKTVDRMNSSESALKTTSFGRSFLKICLEDN